MPVDIIHNGNGQGDVATRLLNNGFNINALRTNDVLLYDEWKEFDKAVLKAAQDRLIGVADLQARGLTYDIPNGLAKTVFAYQDASDLNAAEMSMDGVNRGMRDRPEYDINYLPLPIIHKDFSFSVRNIQESRNGNMPLDTTSAQLAGRKVAEKIETLLFQGSSDYTFGSGVIYGYQDFTHRATTNLESAGWDNSTGAEILADILEAKQALIDDYYYGPYVLYIPTNYETTIDGDYTTGYPKSIRERILEISGISDVRVSDYLDDDNVILVQLTQDVVRLVNGLNIQTIQWDVEGGLQVNFKVMAIMVPQLRADQNDRCGICHMSIP